MLLRSKSLALKHFTAGLFSLVFVHILPTNINAKQGLTQLGKAGDWIIEYSSDNVPSCHVTAGYSSGTVFSFGVIGVEKQYTASVRNQKWGSIRPGGQYFIKYVFNGRRVWKGTASGFPHGFQQLNLKPDFVEAIARSSYIEIYYNNKRIDRLSLRGTRRAKQALMDCYAQHIDNADPFAANGVTTLNNNKVISILPKPRPNSDVSEYIKSDKPYTVRDNKENKLDNSEVNLQKQLQLLSALMRTNLNDLCYATFIKETNGWNLDYDENDPERQFFAEFNVDFADVDGEIVSIAGHSRGSVISFMPTQNGTEATETKSGKWINFLWAYREYAYPLENLSIDPNSCKKLKQ